MEPAREASANTDFAGLPDAAVRTVALNLDARSAFRWGSACSFFHDAQPPRQWTGRREVRGAPQARAARREAERRERIDDRREMDPRL